MRKRTLSFVLALCMIFLSIPLDGLTIMAKAETELAGQISDNAIDEQVEEIQEKEVTESLGNIPEEGEIVEIGVESYLTAENVEESVQTALSENVYSSEELDSIYMYMADDLHTLKKPTRLFSADMNLPNGWDSVPGAKHGTALWRNQW